MKLWLCAVYKPKLNSRRTQRTRAAPAVPLRTATATVDVIVLRRHRHPLRRRIPLLCRVTAPELSTYMGVARACSFVCCSMRRSDDRGLRRRIDADYCNSREPCGVKARGADGSRNGGQISSASIASDD
eukprot:1775359-Pleurochrysis_carterae.AAC.1